MNGELLYQQRWIRSIKGEQIWLCDSNFYRHPLELQRLTVRLSEPERLYIHSFIGHSQPILGRPQRVSGFSLQPSVPRAQSSFHRLLAGVSRGFSKRRFR